MTPLFTKASILVFTCFLAIGCNQASESTTTKTVQTTTPELAKPAKPTELSKPMVQLTEIVLDEKAVITDNKLAKSKKLSAQEAKALSVQTIDSTASGENSYTYHVLDTLFSGSTFKIVLIGREYTEENGIWVASYDNQQGLIHFLPVYYDNSEGFLSITSNVKNNLITIQTFNEYAERESEKQKTEVYRVDEQGKFRKEQ